MGIRSIGRTCDSRATSFAEPFNSAAFRLFLSPARQTLKEKRKKMMKKKKRKQEKEREGEWERERRRVW